MKVTVFARVLLLIVVAAVIATSAPGQYHEKLYVLSSGSDDMTVIDVKTNRIIKRIKVGLHPHGIAAPESHEVLYVATEFDRGLAVVDPVKDEVIKTYNILGERPNEIEVTVTDSGIGIAKENLPRLFEKFQQVHSKSVSGGAKGTGLGLAISKRLVELHGGRIWATGQPRQGSTFSFALPKYHAEELFHELFKHGMEQAKQRKGPMSLVVLSVQNFEELAARHGAEEATRLVREVQAALKGSVRRRDDGDILVKWRRSELAIILLGTDQAGAKAMAARWYGR